MSTSSSYALWSVAPSSSSYESPRRLPTARRRRWLQEAFPQHGFVLPPKRRNGFAVPGARARFPRPDRAGARRGRPALAASGNGGNGEGED